MTSFTIGIVCTVIIIVLVRIMQPHFHSTRPLDRAMIILALTRLGELAQADGETLTLVVVGGAALVLHYNTRPSTQDVDAFLAVPPERRATRKWAATVARETGLPHDWLNDGAKGFMRGVSYGPLLLDRPGIKVYQVSPEQLLAMKLSAWRDEQDEADALTVLHDLRVTYQSKDALWNAIMPYVTDLKAQYAFEELWEDLNG